MAVNEPNAKVADSAADEKNFMVSLPNAAALSGRLGANLARRATRSERGAQLRPAKNRKGWARARGILPLVLDIGLGTVAAGGGLGMPLAVGGLIFDCFGTAGHALLGGGALGGGERRRTGREGFRKHAVDGV